MRKLSVIKVDHGKNECIWRGNAPGEVSIILEREKLQNTPKLFSISIDTLMSSNICPNVLGEIQNERLYLVYEKGYGQSIPLFSIIHALSSPFISLGVNNRQLLRDIWEIH